MIGGKSPFTIFRGFFLPFPDRLTPFLVMKGWSAFQSKLVTSFRYARRLSYETFWHSGTFSFIVSNHSFDIHFVTENLSISYLYKIPQDTQWTHIVLIRNLQRTFYAWFMLQFSNSWNGWNPLFCCTFTTSQSRTLFSPSDTVIDFGGFCFIKGQNSVEIFYTFGSGFSAFSRYFLHRFGFWLEKCDSTFHIHLAICTDFTLLSCFLCLGLISFSGNYC